MDSLQVVELNAAFSEFLPIWLIPLGSITCVGLAIVVAKKMFRIN